MYPRTYFFIFIILALSACSGGQTYGYETPPPFERPLYNPETDFAPLYPVRVNGKYGYIDTTGTVVIEPQYELAYPFEEGLGKVRTFSNNYRILDRHGNTVWEDHDGKDIYGGSLFADGLNCIWDYQDGQHWRAYANRKGEIVIPFFFNKANAFVEGFAEVCVHDPRISKDEQVWVGTPEEKSRRRWGFINTRGELIAPFQYRQTYYFSDGMAAVTDEVESESFLADEKYGFIDTTGQLVIPMEFDIHGIGFHEGLCPVNIDGKIGYIDKTGQFAIQPTLHGGGPFSEGLATSTQLMEDGTRLIGYIDKTGEFVIPPQFDYALEFEDGMACVRDTNQLTGMIDRKGNWIIPPKFHSLIFFNEGIGVVDSGGLHGFIDLEGNHITGYRFDDARSFRDGMAAVTLGGNYWHPKAYTQLGYIDRKGNYIWEPRY